MRLFAIREFDPRAATRIEADLRRNGGFEWVGRPAANWIVAHSGPATGRPHGLFVVEGEIAGTAERCHALSEDMDDPHWASRLAKLPGDFAFASFTRNGRVLFVRAAAGAVPLYAYAHGPALACSTRLGDIARFANEEPKLDPLINAIFCSMFGWFVNRRTFLMHTSIVYGGEAATAESRGWRFEKWWEPPSGSPQRPTPGKAREHADRLRAIVVRNLERNIPADGSALFTVSGGVDSACLVALTAGHLQRSFSTLTFFPANERAHSEVRSYVDPLLDRFSPRVAHRWEYEHSPEARFALLESAPPEIYQVLNPALCVLPLIAGRQAVSVLCGGEFCDDLLGSELTVEDWDLSISIRDIPRHYHEFPRGIRSVLGWGRRRIRHRIGRGRLLRAPDLPKFINPELRAEYRDLLAADRHDIRASSSPRIYLARRLDAAHTAVSQNFEVTSRLGIRRTFPFLSRELVELAFECHPSEGFGPTTKKLLRTAMAGMVPERNLLRPDKDHWTEYPSKVAWRAPIPTALSGVIRSEWLENPPRTLPTYDALRLRLLMNIVHALDNVRAERGLTPGTSDGAG